MPNRYRIYWYKKSASVERAFLYDCRDNDLQPLRLLKVAPRPANLVMDGRIEPTPVGCWAPNGRLLAIVFWAPRPPFNSPRPQTRSSPNNLH